MSKRSRLISGFMNIGAQSDHDDFQGWSSGRSSACQIQPVECIHRAAQDTPFLPDPGKRLYHIRVIIEVS
jgi:hypothetical protein